MEEQNSGKYCGVEKNFSRIGKGRRKGTFEFEKKDLDIMGRKYKLSDMVPSEHSTSNQKKLYQKVNGRSKISNKAPDA